MPQPLYGDDVEYQDGTKASLEQEIIDVVTFLTWAAMPELENRKSSGIKVLFFSCYDIISSFYHIKKYGKILRVNYSFHYISFK